MWLRCVAGALLLYLLDYACFWVVRPYHVPFLWTLPLSMVGALLVGVHLRSWTWVKTWLVVGAVVAAFGALLLFVGLTASGPEGADARVLLAPGGLVVIGAGVVIGITHGVPAAAGVWWGQRREATKIGSSDSSLNGDASTEAMP